MPEPCLSLLQNAVDLPIASGSLVGSQLELGPDVFRSDPGACSWSTPLSKQFSGPRVFRLPPPPLLIGCLEEQRRFRNSSNLGNSALRPGHNFRGLLRRDRCGCITNHLFQAEQRCAQLRTRRAFMGSFAPEPHTCSASASVGPEKSGGLHLQTRGCSPFASSGADHARVVC